MNADQKKEFEVWLAQRPPKVAEVARKLPPDRCYRMAGNAGHYVILSYAEHKSGEVTLTLAHGRDSYLPGVQVFGIRPESLFDCGCEKWEWPLQEQIEETGQHLEAQKKLKNG